MDVLWRAGDPWRDLTVEVRRASKVTFVTRNLTARVLDVDAGVQLRVPRPDGHAMVGDLRWRDAFALTAATPCGVLLEGDDLYDYEATTRVLLVAAGDVAVAWPDSDVGRQLVAAHAADRLPPIVGHPPQRCAAVYCVERSS